MTVTVTRRATTMAATTTAEEFLAKARPVIQRAQGIHIPLWKPLTPILGYFELHNTPKTSLLSPQGGIYIEVRGFPEGDI